MIQFATIHVITVALMISLSRKYCYCDKWAEDKIKKLEEGCMELSYNALTQRYLSILGLYKYTDNPHGHLYNKCYLRLVELGDQRINQHRENERKFAENSRKTELIRIQNELDQRQRRLEQNLAQQKPAEEAKEKESIVIIFICIGIFALCACLGLSQKNCASSRSTSHAVPVPRSSAEQSLLAHRILPQAAVQVTPLRTDNQSEFTIIMTPNPATPRPPSNTGSILYSDMDPPPSYNEATRVTPSAPLGD